MKKIGFRKWEIALMALATVIFFTTLALFVLDFPLRTYLPGYRETGGGKREVGLVSSRKGQVRRELRGETEFKAISEKGALYDGDTIVTGPNSAATIELDDGGTIELGSSSMVRLNFESTLTLGGITRTAQVDVVAGDVTGRAEKKEIKIKSGGAVVAIPKNTAKLVQPPKWTPPPLPAVPKFMPKPIVFTRATPTPSPAPVPTSSPSPRPSPSPVVVAVASPSPTPTPTPSPSPVVPSIPSVHVEHLALVSPKAGSQLKVPRLSKFAQRSVAFEWAVSPSVPLLLTIKSVGKDAPLFSQVVTAVGGKAKAEWIARSPGDFEWELRGPKGERLVTGAKEAVLKPQARFSVEPKFEAIELLDPLVGGEQMSSNALRNRVIQSFDLTFRWKPYPGAGTYRLALANSATATTPLLSKVVAEPMCALNKDRVFAGKIFYSVTAMLDNGFIVMSPTSQFQFSFLPPVLTLPLNQAVIEAGGKSVNERTLLLTWQKTHFTDTYEVELAADAGFARPIIKKSRTDNFLMINMPAPGQYWWRVKSHSKSISSAFSAAAAFTVKSAPKKTPQPAPSGSGPGARN